MQCQHAREKPTRFHIKRYINVTTVVPFVLFSALCTFLFSHLEQTNKWDSALLVELMAALMSMFQSATCMVRALGLLLPSEPHLVKTLQARQSNRKLTLSCHSYGCDWIELTGMACTLLYDKSWCLSLYCCAMHDKGSWRAYWHCLSATLTTICTSPFLKCCFA